MLLNLFVCDILCTNFLNVGVRFQAKSLMEDDFFLNHAERILNAKIVRIPEERGDALKVVRTSTLMQNMALITTLTLMTKYDNPMTNYDNPNDYPKNITHQ